MQLRFKRLLLENQLKLLKNNFNDKNNLWSYEALTKNISAIAELIFSDMEFSVHDEFWLKRCFKSFLIADVLLCYNYDEAEVILRDVHLSLDLWILLDTTRGSNQLKLVEDFFYNACDLTDFDSDYPDEFERNDITYLHPLGEQLISYYQTILQVLNSIFQTTYGTRFHKSKSYEYLTTSHYQDPNYYNLDLY